MYHMYYNNGILGWLMSIMHFAFPIIFIFILFRLFTGRDHSQGHLSGHTPRNTPLDLLKERYVKGEISRDEFQRMKDEIKS